MNAGLLRRWWVHDAAHRPARLVGLTVLVALGVGGLCAAVDGARRSSTAVDRAVDFVRPADGIVVPNEPGFDWKPVATLAPVAELVSFPVLYFEVDGFEGTFGGFPPAAPDRSFEREVVLDGRLADQASAVEVTISPDMRQRGVDVGDQLVIELFSMSEAFAGSSDPQRRQVPVTVVGVTKLSFFAADVQPTAAFFAAHQDLIVGDLGYLNALVRLRPGHDLAELERAVSEQAGRPVEVLRVDDFVEASRDSTRIETIGMVMLASAGAAAMLALFSQVLTRILAGTRDDQELLGQLGLTRWAAGAAVLAGPAGAVALGVALAPLVGWSASDAFPIGVGREMEPSPGRRINWVFTTVTLSASAAVLLALMVLAARRAGRPDRARPAVVDPMADLLRRLPLSIPAALGARLALARRSVGASARSATWIVATSAAAVAAAVAFAGALRDAVEDPVLFGQTFDAGLMQFDQPIDPSGLAVLDPDRVTRLVNLVVPVEGQPVSVVGADDVVGSFTPAMLRGRVPGGSAEAAVSPATAEALGIVPGDMVDIAGHRVEIVGMALLPEVGHTSYTTGMIVSAPLLQTLLADGAEPKFELLAVDLAESMSVADAKGLLPDDLGFAIEPWIEPQRQDDLRPTAPLPWVFAGFVGVLMAGSLAHALATTARQRHREVAVLQVLGLTRSQARRTVLWHAVVATVAGCIAGVPFGVVVGRALWKATARSLPAIHRAPGLWPGTALVVTAVVAAGVVLATAAARRTARGEPAMVLRTE